NALVENSDKEALLETTLRGGEIQFSKEMVIAITGAETDVFINENPIKLWRSYKVNLGDRLKLNFSKSGLRNYIAFSGGVDIPEVMKSRSTDLKAKIGGFEGRKLNIGDTLNVFTKTLPQLKSLKSEYIPSYSKKIEIRVILGQQYDEFTKIGIKTFFNSEYKVTSESDRMGIRLNGDEVEHIKGADILSDGITFGAIQIPGNGQPIIMMADRQTIGGYTKIGNVITADLSLLAQAIPGSKIKFKEVSLDDGVKLLKKEEDVIKNEDSYLNLECSIEKIYDVIVDGKKYTVNISRIK
ncbi:MAG: biotin-dependent carboxyltransferase family protein, partial [Cetobacterium sp.]